MDKDKDRDKKKAKIMKDEESGGRQKKKIKLEKRGSTCLGAKFFRCRVIWAMLSRPTPTSPCHTLPSRTTASLGRQCSGPVGAGGKLALSTNSVETRGTKWS